MKYFGENRVLEPKGTVPVTAWKLDNAKKIGPKEIRINLETIHIEWDNFNQICNHCGHDETRIKARIIQITEERGKLQNPYTGSGGIFLGTIDAIGEEIELKELKVGDRVYSFTTLTGMPMHIESIEEIDYDYGQITCKGYVICFETTEFAKYTGKIESKFVLAAMDEEGNFVSAKEITTENHAKKVAIIGGNPMTTIMYAQTIHDCYPDEAEVIAVMDRNSSGALSEEDVKQAFSPLIRDTYFADVSNPLEACEEIKNAGEKDNCFDAVVNLEDIVGTETIAAFLIKDGGVVFYARIKNNYSLGVLVADSMGKEMLPYNLDGYINNAYEYTIHILYEVLPNLKTLDGIYRSKVGKRTIRRTTPPDRTEFSVERIDDFIYQSQVTKAMVDEALNVAQYDCNVIIQGETGVGKEKIFNIIHQNSPRHGKPCVKINCATIQENLAESEFFGYEKGSFTGAQQGGKPGYFELANNGTLFLDEIGSLSLNMQTKLLRVLQENTYYKVGGTTPIVVNVRVICANNVSLKKLVEEGKFREDLYYRLNICCIEVPPLRERPEDVSCLAEAFLKGYNKKYSVDKELSPEAIIKLEEYHWPGNVRELENTIHRLYISERNRIIDGDTVDRFLNDNVYEELVINIKKGFQRNESVDFNEIMEEQERRLIAYALKKEGTTRKAAEFLNIPQTTLARKKIKYNL